MSKSKEQARMDLLENIIDTFNDEHVTDEITAEEMADIAELLQRPSLVAVEKLKAQYEAISNMKVQP